MPPLSLDACTEKHLIDWLGRHTIDKARAYVDEVQELEIEPDFVSAVIPGSAPRPYHAIAKLIAGRQGQAQLVSTCTCPVGSQCKHVAAMLLRVVAERGQPDRVSPGVLSWVEDLRRASLAVARSKARPPGARQRLFYLLKWTPDQRQFGIEIVKGKFADGGETWWNVERALLNPPQFVGEDDLGILRALWADRLHETRLRAFGLGPKHGAEALGRLVRSGRLHTDNGDGLALDEGNTRPATVAWRIDSRGLQHPVLIADPPAELAIPVQPPWYVDMAAGEAGPLEVAGDPEVIARLFALPPLSASEAAVVSRTLAEVAPDLPKPSEDAAIRLRTVAAPLQPVLQLDSVAIHGNRPWRGYAAGTAGEQFDIARPLFRYADVDVRPDEPHEFVTLPEGETVHLRRRPDEERRVLAALTAAGFEKVPSHLLDTFGRPPEGVFALACEADWSAFMQAGRDALRVAGWQVEYPDDFRHHLLEVDGWEAELVAGEGGWFDLDMGILVDGARLPLAPLLASLFRRDTRWLDSLAVAAIPDDEAIELQTPLRRRIRVPAARIKPLAATLIDLFDGFSGGDTLRVSRFDAPRLVALEDTSRWQFRGQHDILALAGKLQAAQGIADTAPPAGLGLELRPYQKEGLAWLQFLRAHDLSGILADDMGLGKTAQTLAHLLLEKEAGRLDRPALIILPTSLVFNWKHEAARFAPGLSLLPLHGPERKSRFADIPAHDVVLTTYPLLWRDADELTRYSYHLLILDEAQTVKNARSQGAEAVRRIEARHRLCLTGTPLENHLGELWSQFDFLLPGFLGDSRQFARYWRTPIEKGGDRERRDLLARRIRPFILRRRKEDVARELPPKTIIVRSVELEGGQRDLYETVRAAMDSKVREEIALRGFARSQIVILDALLKLRQVCCDPRLVRSGATRRVEERAKLDMLMEMLPELVDEGRRILVFSQFTSMLELIEIELVAAGVPYTLLTGDTGDREGAIRRFQEGEVPVFLISLKAGGIGLNLTAADTVIHYDPWWNPAVENQATDRAHRIGQDKPVFVYKLIVAGSIEEKIIALQERKAELAAGILSDDRSVDVKFGSDDLAALFEPLPG